MFRPGTPRSVARSWERFGSEDPYVGVLNAPRFRAASSEGPERRDFFRSGEEHIERLFATIRAGLVADFSPRRALDFGCGVGRLLIPLARRVPEVVGVDVSPSMLREAARNCAEAQLANVSLLDAGALGDAPGVFDLIHSYIVFQHIPERPGRAIVRRLLGKLADDGVGALHFVYGSQRPAWRNAVHWVRKRVPLAHPAMNLLQGRPARSPLMEINRYRLRPLLALLQEQGCHRVVARFSDHGGWLGVFLIFQKRRELDLQVL
jgi:SAM-dependent methyltransferase